MDQSNAIIEELFRKFKPLLENDHNKYKNHVYRVFLNCLLIDDCKENEEKYAIASVFHDIGIWTNHTIDYLNPSMQQASAYLTKIDQHDWIDEINLMIDSHHKISRYKGRFDKTVETFRKADWIDVTLGVMTFNVDKKKISENMRLLPNNGFHVFLIKKITLNFFKHPFNPLPMFKK
jgi:hypothetical protein